MLSAGKGKDQDKLAMLGFFGGFLIFCFDFFLLLEKGLYMSLAPEMLEIHCA